MWPLFKQGGIAPPTAFLLAAFAAVGGVLLAVFVLGPLEKLLSKLDPAKIAEPRTRRVRAAFLLASVAFGGFVYFHATMGPAERIKFLPFGICQLALVTFGGFGLFEILLTAFADTLPQARGRSPMAPIFKDLLRTVLILAIFILGVKVSFPEADIGAIVTTSAILSVVIGLALQESLSNIFAGLMLTIDRPYKPGEWVLVEGRECKVLDSNWRSTRLLTREEDVVYVPNSTMAKSSVVNYTAPSHLHLCRRKMGVEYGAPPNKVRSVFVSLMTHVEGVVKDPAPDAYVLEYADFSIVYELRFWIEDFARRERIEAEVMRGVWYHLKREGISIPFPIRDVYLKREKPARKPEDLLALLQRVDILKPLNEQELLMLADDLAHHLYAKGEVICRQGDPGSTFYLIKTGAVSVIVKGAGGAEAEVAQLRAGTYFGEMSLLTGEPRSSTCRALEDSELLCLDRESFSVLLQENPPVAQAMSEILAARSTATQEKLALERETMSRNAPRGDEGGPGRILEKIRSIFGFGK